MSTSLLYHCFGIRGYQYVRCLFVHGWTVIKIRQQRQNLRCPVCNSRHVKLRGTFSRVFRTRPIGLKPVFIEFPIPRIECLQCGMVRRVKVQFADPRRTYTRAFEQLVLSLSQHMTIKSVAQLLCVGWDLVKEIQKRNLHRRFAKPSLKGLKIIAIDEISIGKGQQFLTIVMDLASGRVVFVGEGKGADALDPFWRRLRRSKARIKAVAIDMSQAYISAITSHLPDAHIVFDHFHLIKLYNDKLTAYRRQLYHQVKDDKVRNVIKGTRWLLLKRRDKLDPERNEENRLNQALDLNAPLAACYYMLDDLRQVWKQSDKAAAKDHLIDWVYDAGSSGIRMLRDMAHTVAKHFHGILAYYDYRISTGPLEGTNNKIKTMKRQAYGFGDKEFFKLKILGIHLTKYALTG